MISSAQSRYLISQSLSFLRGLSRRCALGKNGMVNGVLRLMVLFPFFPIAVRSVHTLQSLYLAMSDYPCAVDYICIVAYAISLLPSALTLEVLNKIAQNR